MSLQVWLPLNGNLQQQGLSSVNATMMGTGITYSAGKIGQAATFPNNCNSCIYLPRMRLQTGTYAAWIKVTGAGATSRQCIISEGRDSYNDGVEFYTSQAGTSLSFKAHEKVITTTITLNQWYHVAGTFGNGEVKLYVNSELKGTQTYTADTTYQYALDLVLGKMSYSYTNTSNYFSFNGQLNDVRIYDHALSVKEIEEIAKGLVLHYKLDDVKTSIWGLNYYKKTATLTTSSTYIYSLPSKTIYLVPGKQYTVGAQVKVNQDNIKFYFDTNCTDENGVYTGNDAAQTVQYNPTITLEKDTWTQVWVTTTIKSDAGKPYYHHGFLFRTTSGELTTLCEIQNIEVYEGSAQILTTYDKTNTVYDSSGYNNNGSINNITVLNDSSRYNNGVKFNGSNSYIKVNENKIFAQHAQAMTINLWVKNTTWSNGANMKFFSCTESGGFNCEAGNSGYVRFPIYVCTDAAQTSYAYKYDSNEIQASALIANEWNMITWVYDTNGTKTYINGQLHHIYSNTSYGIHFNTNARLFLGCEAAAANPSSPYYNGQMSDFRMYYTALSSEAILELYNTSATIDNNGNIYSRGFIENDNLNITKTGLFQTSTIEDDNNGQASIFKTKKILGTNLYEY